MLNRKLITFLSLLIITGLAGCASPANQSVPAMPTHLVTQPTPTAIVFPTPTIAQPTSTQAPPPETPVSVEPKQINLYFIAIGDEGRSGEKIGCGDSLVAVPTQIEPTGDPIRDALHALFAVHDRMIGQSGLYNSLYQSNLKVGDVRIDENGQVSVQLSGQYQLGGVCDDPRFKAQIEATILQLPNVNSVSVTINGKPLDEIVSEKGEVTVGPAVFEKANIYLIALENPNPTGTPVGCGDTLVPVEVPISPASDPQTALKEALQELLSAGDRYASGAGLYNVFHQSDLQVQQVVLENGKATVELSGTLSLGGECDNPRVSAQLVETARQFNQVEEVEFFINGKPLKEVLSLAG